MSNDQGKGVMAKRLPSAGQKVRFESGGNVYFGIYDAKSKIFKGNRNQGKLSKTGIYSHNIPHFQVTRWEPYMVR